ncbi:hypothetical protein FISHEDRAFT_65102 [Fistulina hepatica ATCC 64428]|uniref:UBC core domain-containing protein n=1 Tax=Fistulina hepatica ATCC 64428 TaxID=1128425 RepID=A0A0D7AET7_9AGAR|nr:hypothetical protein FISHEDRAFT_65102 [Fistulina hepatica ATCC 64428]
MAARIDALSAANNHLKGRKRFNADLKDLSEQRDLVLNGFRLMEICRDDDEGAIVLMLADVIHKHALSLHIIVTDTSDYPREHNLVSYSDDALPPRLLEVVEGLNSESPRPLAAMLLKLTQTLASAVKPKPTFAAPVDSDDSDVAVEDDDEIEVMYDSDDDDPSAYVDVDRTNEKMLGFQRDFIDTVATGYIPGIVRTNISDFCLSVSYPVVRLAELIPPRALMAWDRRLLLRSQHIVLLITGFHECYPVLEPDGTYSYFARRASVNLSFKVGLTQAYKPSREGVLDCIRNFGLIQPDASDELRQRQAEAEARRQQEVLFAEDEEPDPDAMDVDDDNAVQPELEDPGAFDRFSLSSSLEPLMDKAFLKLVQYRRKYVLGWAGAESLLSMVEKLQMKAEDVYATKSDMLFIADQEERALSRAHRLPHDPLDGLGANERINLPLTAFCYLIRRLAICTRYCIVCHDRLETEFEALKPYVCGKRLCSYQYYALNRGPSLEYEISHNPFVVDLLVSLAYTAAIDQVLSPLPVGLGLRVPLPEKGLMRCPPSQMVNGAFVPTSALSTSTATTEFGPDGLCNFDTLPQPLMRLALLNLLDSLPSISDMDEHLRAQIGPHRAKAPLTKMDPKILPAAWILLRWIVASCTSHLEEIVAPEERIQNVDNRWRQFRFTVGAPDAEAKFRTAQEQAKAESVNAMAYPSIYAFHGSPLCNWHSIIRNGLWFREIAHGRAFGHGVYFSKTAELSMQSYTNGNRTTWKKSTVEPLACVALTEIVNLPDKFVSQNPHYVVQHTDWLMCRYLLVNTAQAKPPLSPSDTQNLVPLVKIDPQHKTSMKSHVIGIPDPSYKVDMLLEARKQDYVEPINDMDDAEVYGFIEVVGPQAQTGTSTYKGKEVEMLEISDDEEDKREIIVISDDESSPQAKKSKTDKKGKAAVRPVDDWKHDREWVSKCLPSLLPPPVDAQARATMAVQRELRAMIREQESASSLRELGWYLPQDLVEDNLFQWIVEMHSFDPDIPLAQDMKTKNLNSVVFEVRFPPTFPLDPPFFRIISPRFLPFIQGGGGHITGGGSICMDLLTASGWLPSYSIPAVLMQIKLAVSNLEPRPARLASNWQIPYSVREALEGFRRAANAHNWTVPPNLEKLLMA